MNVILRFLIGPPRKRRVSAPDPDDFTHIHPHPGPGNWHGLSNGEWMCGTCGGLGTRPSALTGREVTCGDCKGRPYR